MKALAPDKQALAKILERTAKRFVEGKSHLDDGRKVIAKLRKGEALTKRVGSGLIQKLAKIFPEFINLSKTEATRRARSEGFKRLFGKKLKDMRAHPERRKYHAVLEELHAETAPLRAKNTPADIAALRKQGLIDEITGANRAIDPRTFQMLQDAASVLYHILAGSIDSYTDLAEETKVFNGIMKVLYPEKFLDEFRLDAQHIVEQRAFDKFKSIWNKLGWDSRVDLPAIPLHYRFHIRSPKYVETFAEMMSAKERNAFAEVAEIAKKKDIVSLTDLLERAITGENLAKMSKPEEYIAKLIDFYTPSKSDKLKREVGEIGKDIVPVLKEIEREIGNVRTLEKGFSATRR
jgi:hypothetical protein